MYTRSALPTVLYGWWGSLWCSVPLEEVQQGYCDVISPLLPEFFTSSTDFYLPEDKLHGKRQLKKSAEATVPVEWDFEGSFPFPSACSQIAVHRDSPCARTAVHLALVSQACVDGANYKEKFIWERLGDTQTHVNKQWDWSSKTWFVPSWCLCPGRCQASLWVSAFQLCREQNRSFLLFVWVIALVCSALYNAVILCACFLEHQLGKASCGEIWAIGNCWLLRKAYTLLPLCDAVGKADPLPKMTIFKLKWYLFNLAAQGMLGSQTVM